MIAIFGLQLAADLNMHIALLVLGTLPEASRLTLIGFTLIAGALLLRKLLLATSTSEGSSTRSSESK